MVTVIMAALIGMAGAGGADDALCRVTNAEALVGTQEVVRALTPPEESATFFVTDAKSIFVVVRPLSAEPKAVRVIMSAKAQPAGAFNEICDSGLESYKHDDVRILQGGVAEAAGRWRIDIKNPDQVGLGVVVYVFRDRASPEAYQDPLDFVCIDSSTWTATSSVPTGLLQDVAPIFRVDDETGSLGDVSKRRFWVEFIEAVEAWNVAARTTGLGMLVAGVSDHANREDVINARLAKYLTAFPSFDPSNVVAQAAYRDVDMDLALASRTPGSAAWVDSSMFVGLDNTLRSKICSVDPAVFFVDAFRRAQKSLCAPSDERPTIVVKLVTSFSERSRCGDAVIFGCELGDGRTIELNVKDFAYTSHADGKILFGDGNATIDLLLVCLHEIGHALGLTHDSLRGDKTVMDSYPSPAACLTNDVHEAVAQTRARLKGSRRD